VLVIFTNFKFIKKNSFERYLSTIKHIILLQKLFNSGVTREQYTSINPDATPEPTSQTHSDLPLQTDQSHARTSGQSHARTTGQSHARTTGQSNTRTPVHTDNSVTDVCIICQVNDVNKAFLPCRHACICDRCFEKVDKCPMCRGYIYSYFNLSDEVEQSLENVEEEGGENEHWFYRWNNRLNQYLGFT
jgi:hypothetical protein